MSLSTFPTPASTEPSTPPASRADSTHDIEHKLKFDPLGSGESKQPSLLGAYGAESTSEAETDSDGDSDVAYTSAYTAEHPPIPHPGPMRPLPVDKNTPDEWVARDGRLIRLTGKHPFNVEPPLQALWESGFLTPVSLFYVRNHGYVPHVSEDEARGWTLNVHGLVKRPISFSLADLKRMFRTVTLPVTLVCAGNRRGEQNVVTKGLGFNWGAAGVSTALFTGVYLADVLAYCRPIKPMGAYPYDMETPGRARHVIFEGIDELPKGKYGTSQRLLHATDRSKGMLLAWAMNGEPLTPDHGYPLRLVVPGQIGGRMVKWLNRIEVSDKESQHFLHFKDNKVLPTTLTADQARAQEDVWHDPKYIFGELGVNAVITQPAHDQVLPVAPEPQADGKEATYRMQGFAYTGGGRRITRVEVTLDDGQSWLLSDLTHSEDMYRLKPIRAHPVFGDLDLSESEMSFCWTFWSIDVPWSELVGAKVAAIRAMDEALATMPRDMYWNATSMGNNWWFRIAVVPAAVEGSTSPNSSQAVRFEHPSIVGKPDNGWMQRLKAEGQDPAFPQFGVEFKKDEATQTAAPVNAGPSDLELMTDPAKLTTQVSRAQLAEHANDESPWFVVRGQVYDGTSFLSGHPGGASSITLAAGEDATEDFMAIHSSDAKAMMRQYHVGALVAGDAPIGADEPEDGQGPFLHPKKWKAATLESRKPMSGDSYMFRFKLDRTDQEPGLPTGQHLFIRLDDGQGGDMVQRAYTPFSGNNLLGYIDVLIKVYAPCATYPMGGKMTTRLECLPIGSPVELKGPFGEFTYLGQGRVKWNGVDRKVKNLAMIAGGSGITPIWSTLRRVMDDAPPPLGEGRVEVWLVDANRTESDILARDQIDQEVQRCDGRFRPWHVLSRPSRSWNMSRGRITREILKQHLCPPPAPAKDGELEDTLVLVCGPPPMEQVVRTELAAIGWDVERTAVFF